jgi:hypothetical protein
MNKDISSMNVSLNAVPLCMIAFIFYLLIYRRYISYRFLLWRFSFFELEAIPSWYRLLEPRMNRLSNIDRVSG